MIEEYLIEGESVGLFAPFIPQRLIQEIEQEKVFAVGAYDSWENEVVGVILFREMDGWMELVWVKFSEMYQTSEDARLFVKNRLDRAKSAGILTGAFIDYVDEEEAEETAWIFDALGFRKDVVPNDVYELTVADVKNTEILHRPTVSGVRSLASLNDENRKKIAKTITADERAIPLEYPVNWDRYDDRISVAYMDQTDPKGLLLLEWKDDMLVFSCAWAAEPKVLVLMLISALKEAEQTGTQDFKIIIPVLDKQTADLVEKLVPTAVCREKIERSLSFSV